MLRENTLALRRQLSSNFSQRPGSLDRATLHVCVRPTADTMFESSRNDQQLPPVCWCLRLFACVAVFALLLGTLWLFSGSIHVHSFLFLNLSFRLPLFMEIDRRTSASIPFSQRCIATVIFGISFSASVFGETNLGDQSLSKECSESIDKNESVDLPKIRFKHQTLF